MAKEVIVLLSLVAASMAMYPNYAPYWWGYPHGAGAHPYYNPHYWGGYNNHFYQQPGYFPGYYPQPERMAFYGEFTGRMFYVTGHF